jgi:hypothetical protein
VEDATTCHFETETRLKEVHGTYRLAEEGGLHHVGVELLHASENEGAEAVGTKMRSLQAMQLKHSS